MGYSLGGLRGNKKISQKEAADLIGVSVETWSNWENAKTFPNVLKIKRIEEVFGVEYKDIIFLPDITVKPLTKQEA